MIISYLRVAAALLATSALLHADFTYEETAKMTGGAAAAAMRVVGVFSRQVREPIKTTVMVKGNRMARVSADSVQVIDLDKETITDVDVKKRTYTVITFAQMAQMMEQVAQKMGEAKTQQNANIEFKVDSKETGESKMINGLNARQMIYTVEMEMTDPQSGQKATMVITSDNWTATGVAGWDEVQKFWVRMAQKGPWRPGASAMMQAQSAKGMAAIQQAAAKLEGMPVLSTVRTSMKGEGMPATMPAESAQGAQQTPPPTAGGVASQAAGAAAAGAAGRRMGGLGGLAGGLGGLGRRKKQPDQQEAPPQQPPPPDQAAPPAGASAGVLAEITTELTSFSSGVDASKFDAPAGFKQVEHEAVKALRR